MKIVHTLDEWSRCHVKYDLYTHLKPDDFEQSAIAAAEQQWRQKLLKSPNGFFLTYTSMLQMLKESEKLYFLHVTSSFDSIVKFKTLHPSGGSLVGSIYCTPLVPTDRGLRLHNLGSYILTQESPCHLDA